MRGLWVMIGLAACADKDPAPRRDHDTPPRAAPQPPTSGNATADSKTPQPFHEQAEASTKPAEATVLEYRATWANIVTTTPDCWFFSGPAGRDTPLGDRLTVRIDASQAWATWGQATFEGTWSDSAIDVLRLATHSYQGTWVISERLTGRTTEKGVHAKYTYNECEQGTKCPGECSITADVLLVPK